MTAINVQAITKAIQEMVNLGKVTILGDSLVYHSNHGAFRVGTEDDLISAWALIKAHESKDNN